MEKFTISKRIGRRVGGLFLDIDRVFFEGFIHYVSNIIYIIYIYMIYIYIYINTEDIHVYFFFEAISNISNAKAPNITNQAAKSLGDIATSMVFVPMYVFLLAPMLTQFWM